MIRIDTKLRLKCVSFHLHSTTFFVVKCKHLLPLIHRTRPKSNQIKKFPHPGTQPIPVKLFQFFCVEVSSSVGSDFLGSE